MPPRSTDYLYYIGCENSDGVLLNWSSSWKKEDIVKEFYKIIPNFMHKETGRSLDGKM